MHLATHAAAFPKPKRKARASKPSSGVPATHGAAPTPAPVAETPPATPPEEPPRSSQRRCLVETVLAMHAAGKQCSGDDLVLVAWARWPTVFSVAGAGTPSDHKVRSTLAKVGGVLKRTTMGVYEPTAKAHRYPKAGEPEREVVDAEGAVVLLRAP